MRQFTEPLVFKPLYQERVWGGRSLETSFGRTLPAAGVPYGESWELVDREHEQSVSLDGPSEGKTLHELWRKHRKAVFGPRLADNPSARFPLLVKILDARDRLSLQVHPPAHVAPTLGGEPKTEMWYIAQAEPGAQLFVGLRDSVTRAEFEASIASGGAEKLVHAIAVSRGDFIFIPSGRIHAIGSGLVIYEIQQNSDTTFRVFDWNRVGLDGKPRAVHVQESLQCINFQDVEPRLGQRRGETLVECDHFKVENWRLAAGESRPVAPDDTFAVVTVISGPVMCGSRMFRPGDFFLVPACAVASLPLSSCGKAVEVLVTTLPE